MKLSLCAFILCFPAVTRVATAERFPVEHLTVEQFEQRLSAIQNKSDAAAARELVTFALSERVTPLRLARWQAQLPGEKSRQALLALSDGSQFLRLPPPDIPADPTPTLAIQDGYMRLTVNYVTKTLSQLPNFFATREVTYFEDTPASITNIGVPYKEPMHFVGRSDATILYRNGYDEVKPSSTRKDRKKQSKDEKALSKRLSTSGEFGAIIRTVIVDASHGTVLWDHWEHGSPHDIAVFRFMVPQEKAHYHVPNCCAADAEAARRLNFPGYHGEIAIDPQDGTIVRLTIEADLHLTQSIVTAEIMVEYGTVQIAGTSYFCPLRSVSILQSLITGNALPGPEAGQKTVKDLTDPERSNRYRTSINDVVFTDFHRFRSDAKILTGEEVPEDKPAASPPW